MGKGFQIVLKFLIEKETHSRFAIPTQLNVTSQLNVSSVF